MWYFVSPQVIFGEDALEALSDLTGSRAFIVTDENLIKLGVAEKVRDRLLKAGMDTCFFRSVEPDPSVQTVLQGKQAALDYQPDWIIGLGGGSCMDAAKAIWVLYERPDLDPKEINPLITLGLRKKARLITIPTTSGTGAEVTWAIVLTDTHEQRKLGLGNRENVADIAIIDPTLAAGMPAQLTADTGLDALTHAIEGYTCTWHSDLTDGMCLQAASLVFEYLPRAITDPQDMEARERMHNAATCAGLGFGNAMASLAHAMGHTIGSIFHIPHGKAVGLALPYTIEFASAVDPSRFARLVAVIGCSQEQGEKAGRELADSIRRLCRQIGEPTSFREAGIQHSLFEENLDKLVEDAFCDTQILTAVRMPDFDELRRLFIYAYEGRPVDF